MKTDKKERPVIDRGIVRSLENLEMASIMLPGIGKTYNLCIAAKKINAIVFSYNKMESERLKKEYNVRSVPLESCMHGQRGPAYADPHTLGVLANRIRFEISRLEQYIDYLEGELK